MDYTQTHDTRSDFISSFKTVSMETLTSGNLIKQGNLMVSRARMENIANWMSALTDSVIDL